MVSWLVNQSVLLYLFERCISTKIILQTGANLAMAAIVSGLQICKFVFKFVEWIGIYILAYTLVRKGIRYNWVHISFHYHIFFLIYLQYNNLQPRNHLMQSRLWSDLHWVAKSCKPIFSSWKKNIIMLVMLAMLPETNLHTLLVS
jgi:hypothetical protein